MPIYFGQDGVAISDGMQFSTIEDGITLITEEAYPRCMWKLPGLTAERYEALALFQNDEDAMGRFFSYVLREGAGSADFVVFFPLLARSIIDHLAAEHPLCGRKGADVRIMRTRSATCTDRETAQWATQQVVTVNE
ncbi:hypothetical protein [Streptomyces sp. NPDC014685]|uniref:hypothetical protein n=1 Tax=Streptomyces sp. NPDC014685 TaxID=3364881 RepID=UPI0037032584